MIGISTSSPPAEQLVDLMRGYRVPQCLYLVVHLGIAELLEGGPVPIDDLARVTDCHAQSLARTLRALASVGIFVEVEPSVFGHSPMSEYLRQDHPDSCCAAVQFLGAPYAQLPWTELEYSVRTGRSAFERVHGMDKWEYGRRHPDDGAIFDRMLAVNRADRWEGLASAWDFSRSKVVVDIGGGYGHVLIRGLQSMPSLQGILYDLPHVVSRAAELVEAGGVLDRCRLVGGSFFEHVPAGDIYLLSDVLHDWPDDDARAILQACRASMTSTSRLLIMETLLIPCEVSRPVAMMDLTMLVEFGGGRQRTLEEFQELLATADLEIERVERSLPRNMSVLVATTRRSSASQPPA